MGGVARSILPAVGTAVGGFFGGPAGAAAGGAIGGAIGNAVDPLKEKKISAPNLGGVIKQGDTYANLATQQRDLMTAQQGNLQAADVAKALSERAMGRGPSLAEAQLRSATNRNLSQQLAAASAMRGRNVGTTQRQLLQQQGEAGRNLAQDAATARLAEQQAAQNAVLNQSNVLGQSINQNLQSGYGFKTGARIQQAQLQAQADALNADIASRNVQNQRQMEGSLLSAAGQLASSYYGSKPTTTGTQVGSTGPELKFKAQGGIVQGTAEKSGDSVANDKVPHMLSPGEIVIPRSVATSPEKAKRFVAQILEQEAIKKSAKKLDMQEVISKQARKKV
jgi:hypothetical protein